MAVRSNYIKQLMENKNSLEKQYQEVVAESMKNIIGENAKDEVRKLLKEAEDEDSFEEEEVVDDTAADTDKEETAGTEVADEVEDGVDAVEDDVWDDLENCKSADGEYDCRGMEDDKLVKVLKAMGPEDGIRVMSNGDGTVQIEVDGDMIDGTQEFVLDLDDNSIELDDDFDDDEAEVELELESKNIVGYTDDYQKETAMTTPDNHEPANPKTTYSMDAGVPKGTEKPWAQDGDRQPFDESIDECGTVFEVEQDDDEELVEASHTVTQNNGNVRGVTKSFPTNSSSQETDRNGAPEGQ